MVLQSTLFFSPSTYLYVVFHEAFFLLTIRMSMVSKFFRVATCVKELSSINMHDISIEWCCSVTWQIKYISPPAEDLLTPQKARWWVLEGSKHDPLIKWPTWGHMTIWKFYIFISMRLIANKLGRLLTLGSIPSPERLSHCQLLAFKIFRMFHWWYLYFRMLGEGLQSTKLTAC